MNLGKISMNLWSLLKSCSDLYQLNFNVTKTLDDMKTDMQCISLSLSLLLSLIFLRFIVNVFNHIYHYSKLINVFLLIRKCVFYRSVALALKR